MIPQSFIQQLVSSCDVMDIVGSYVNIKRAGRHSTGLCPFHSEKSPSFVVYQDTQSFFCFGCGAGGDVITFIKRIENLDYVESIRFLASRAGMTVPEGDVDDRQAKLRQRIYDINRESARFFHSCLKHEVGRDGLKYLRERGLTTDTITGYGLGFAPDTWDSLYRHLRQKGYTNDEMTAAAVCAKGKQGSCYDMFRNRVIFPIIDLRGNVIAFGGRVLDDSKPKYLNSPDTLVFKKSKNLFSLNFAKNEIKDTVILAEGYMDVIAINAAGFKNVVATLGTALTDEQCRLMAKYAKQVVIAYDSDEAGQKATRRAVNLLSEAGIGARVLVMDGAKDPDEYIKKFGTKRFQLLLDNAGDVIEHELNGLKKQFDIKTAEGKIDYIKRAVLVLADIKNPLEREVYAAMVAGDTGSMTDTVLTSVDAIRRKQYKKANDSEWRAIEQNQKVMRDRLNPEKKEHLKEATAEEHIITYMFKHPDMAVAVYEKAGESFVTDFNRRVYRAAYRFCAENPGVELTVSAVSEGFTSEEMGGIAGIIARCGDVIISQEALDEYIKILLNYKDTLSKDDILNVATDDIEQYRMRLRSKK